MELLFIWQEEYDIVHIPDVLLDAHMLRDKLVQWLQQVICQPLRQVEAKRDAFFKSLEAPPDDVQKPIVLDPDAELPHQDPQPDIIVKVPDVRLLEIPCAFCVFPQPALDLPLPKMRAALREGAAGIPAGRSHYDWLQNNDDDVVQSLLVDLRHVNRPPLAMFKYLFRLPFLWPVCKLRMLHPCPGRLRV